MPEGDRVRLEVYIRCYASSGFIVIGRHKIPEEFSHMLVLVLR